MKIKILLLFLSIYLPIPLIGGETKGKNVANPEWLPDDAKVIVKAFEKDSFTGDHTCLLKAKVSRQDFSNIIRTLGLRLYNEKNQIWQVGLYH